MDPRIADYIRANRKRYTREAITKQLIQAGHDPDDVERTWAAFDAPDPDGVAGEGFWSRFALIVVGINLGVFLLVAFLTGMLQAMELGGGMMALVFAVVLATGAAIAWALVASTGPTKLSPTTALVVGTAIPLLFALLIGGACYALVGARLPGVDAPRQGHAEVRIEEPFRFDGSGPALCMRAAAADAGFSVYTEDLGTVDGQRVNVQLDALSAPPGAAPEPGMVGPSLFIAVSGQTELAGVGYHTAPASTVQMDASPGGLSGTMRFERLEGNAMDADGPTDPSEPMSGTFTWDCPEGGQP